MRQAHDTRARSCYLTPSGASTAPNKARVALNFGRVLSERRACSQIPCSPVVMKPSDCFDLHESVGRDELGEVVRATERSTSKRAALKRFDAWTLDSDDGRDGYRAALLALRDILPARTPPVSHFEFSADQGWIASRWVDGENLAELLQERETLPFDEATRVVCGILDALDELHSAGEAHGGLSPRKVLLLDGTDAGGVVVTDPFQHYLYSVADPIKTARKEPQRFLGLPEYFSPEQARGERPDVRSDVYVVGLLFYEILTGKTPFGAKSVSTTLKRQIYEKPLPAHIAKPGLDVPGDAEAILQTALNKDPAQRFQSVRAFRRAINSLRENFEESAERAAAPMGIAPDGVLVGRPVPTGPHPSIVPSAPEPEPHRSERGTEPQSPLAVIAPEPVVDQSPADEDAQRSESEPAVDSAEPTESASTIDASAEADSADEAGIDPAPNESKRAKKRRGKKGRASKPRLNDTESIGEVTATAIREAAIAEGLDDSEERPAAPEEASTSNASTKRKAAAKSSSSQKAAGASTSQAVPVQRGPLSVDDDDELGWFALGNDAEALVEREAVVAEVEGDESGAQNRRFVIGIAAALVVVVLGVVAFANLYGGDDESETEAGTATAEAPAEPEAPAPSPEVPEPSPEVAAVVEAEPPLEGTADTLAAAEGSATPNEDDAAPAAIEDPVQVDGALPTAPAPEPASEPEPTPAPAPAPAPEQPSVVTPTPRPAAPAPTPGPSAAERERAAAAAAAEAEAARQAEAARAAEAQRSSDAQAALRAGQSAAQSRNWGEAASQFERAIELDSGMAAAQHGLGQAYFQQGNYAGATRYLRNAVRMNSRNADYQLDLGQAYFRQGNLDQALESFERASALGHSGADRALQAVRARIAEQEPEP